MLENRVLRRMFESEKEIIKEDRNNYIRQDFTVCVLHRILLGP
jgi:hypothetical protein